MVPKVSDVRGVLLKFEIFSFFVTKTVLISVFKPFNDWHLISLYSISPESNIKVMRTREMINNQRTVDCSTNSPFQTPKKCLENSMENMHTDVWA